MLTNKEDIEHWLKDNYVANYTINEDLTVDVHGPVLLYGEKIKSIDVQFNIIHGEFNCYNNLLTSLEGCPREVYGQFSCMMNQLTSLEFSPKIVQGSFYCFGNQLTSLVGCPDTIAGSFNCDNNLLTNLEGCPQFVDGDFSCGDNKIIDIGEFKCKFTGQFIHEGEPIPYLKDYYFLNKDDPLRDESFLELQINYEQFQKRLLFDRLDNNLDIPPSTTKKIKI